MHPHRHTPAHSSHIHTYAHTHANRHRNAYTHAPMHTHRHTHTHVHTHTHTCMHTHYNWKFNQQPSQALTSSAQSWLPASLASSRGVLPALFSMLARSGRVRSISFMHSVLFSWAHRCSAVLPSCVFLSRLPLWRLVANLSLSHGEDGQRWMKGWNKCKGEAEQEKSEANMCFKSGSQQTHVRQWHPLNTMLPVRQNTCQQSHNPQTILFHPFENEYIRILGDWLLPYLPPPPPPTPSCFQWDMAWGRMQLTW